MQVIVSGHICADLIPELTSGSAEGRLGFSPGSILEVGPLHFSTGGAVANTGLALHRLGISAVLMGGVGDDRLGDLVLALLAQQDPDLTEGIFVLTGQSTSYSIVLSPPGRDRMFLHHPGANDEARASDFPLERFPDARILHFGYPTVMAQMHMDGGRQTQLLLDRARKQGLITTMDVSIPEPVPGAQSGYWRRLLEQVLPRVDIILPSLEETAFLLAESTSATQLGETLIGLGAGIAVIKMGQEGIYLRTSRDAGRLGFLERIGLDPSLWRNLELHSSCFEVRVAGTTGTGDSAVAGFLAALLKAQDPVSVLECAAAAGACSAEALDATSGIPHWEALIARITGGWLKKPWYAPIGWREYAGRRVWQGPRHKADHPSR